MASRGDTEQRPEAAWFYFKQHFIFTEVSPLWYIVSSPGMAMEEQYLPIMGQHKQLGYFSWLPCGCHQPYEHKDLGQEVQHKEKS